MLIPSRNAWVSALTSRSSRTASTKGPIRSPLDAGSVGTITLYPKPTVGGTLSQVCEEFPATIALGSSTVAVPSVLQDYFTYRALEGARRKESDARMEEMADHFAERCDLYEKVIEHLWGAGQ